MSYSIAAAVDTGLFDHIAVSTDDAEIAEVARACGAETPFVRPAALSDDFTGTNAVVAHAVAWYREQGHDVRYACCVYATAPMMEARYIRLGWDALAASGVQFAFSVTSFPFPIQRALRILPDGSIEALQPKHRMTRSQDLEPTYHDAAQFYWGTADAFVSSQPLFATHSAGVVLPRHLVQDIDTPEDWERAELMYRAWRGAK